MRTLRFLLSSFIVVALFSILSMSVTANADYTCNDITYLKATLDQLNQSCGGTAEVCTAVGHKGSTADSAVDACVKSGYTQSSCDTNVTCEHTSLCSAVGHKGTTVESAIRHCTDAGYTQSSCDTNVTCENGRSICSAVGHKGSTLELAVRACVKAGYTESSCNSNVSCP